MALKLADFDFDFTAGPSNEEQTFARDSIDKTLDMDSIDTAPPKYELLEPPGELVLERMPSPPTHSPHNHNFHADDFVEDDRIARFLLEQDSWLPDPPAEPAQQRIDDFSKGLPHGNAVVTYADDNGLLGKIENLHLDIIEQRSPLIAAAFEASDRQYCLHLDALTPLSARPFVRFLYVGSYAEVEDQYEEVPSSLLLHCQLHCLGSLFDIVQLRSQALVNVIRNCEFACFSPDQPIDLVSAIRYCYDHIDYCHKPVENIIAYCIERFSAHRLGHDSAFLALAYVHKPFHHDLAKALVERNFRDEAALEIIRLPVSPALVNDGSFISQKSIHRPRDQGKRPLAEAVSDEQGCDATEMTLDAVSETLLKQKGAKAAAQAGNQQSLLTMALRGKQPMTTVTTQAVNNRPHKRVKSEDEFVLVDRSIADTRPNGAAGSLQEEAHALEKYEPSAGESDNDSFVLVTCESSGTSGSNGEASSARKLGSPALHAEAVLPSSTAHGPSNGLESRSSSPKSDSSWVQP